MNTSGQPASRGTRPRSWPLRPRSAVQAGSAGAATNASCWRLECFLTLGVKRAGPGALPTVGVHLNEASTTAASPGSNARRLLGGKVGGEARSRGLVGSLRRGPAR
eukprot:10643186-Alexandrium_andersonii.AAC.1